MQKEKLEKLVFEKSKPCVTISLNTHRTHPENIQDSIVLKKLISETEEKLIAKFGKEPIKPLLEKLEQIPEGIDINHNLDSLHIFLSNETKEIVKSIWPVKEDKVLISDTFAIGSLINSANRDFEYLILLLSQTGAKLFIALNNSIVGEIENDHFPFIENAHLNTGLRKINNSKSVDNMVREYFNNVDKALLKVYNQTGLNCLAICTDFNYGRLMQVADKPSIYGGHTSIDFSKLSNHRIAAQAWEIIKEQQVQREKTAIDEMKEAAGHGKVITDLFKIYLAVKEGRGELLIAFSNYSQAVNVTGELTSDVSDDDNQHVILEEISNELAREVIMKKGRVVFTDSEEIKSLGDVVLKLRY